jgi:hypothetical protein
MPPKMELCRYSKVCKHYEVESFTCNYSESDRVQYCGVYKGLGRDMERSQHHRRPLKDSWLIKLLRQFRK